MKKTPSIEDQKKAANELLGAVVRTVGGHPQAWKVRSVVFQGVDPWGMCHFDFRGVSRFPLGGETPHCALNSFVSDLEVVTPAPTPSAEICLYGTTSAGFGWLAAPWPPISEGVILGTGELDPASTMTSTIAEACKALKLRGFRGEAWLVEPTGERRARVTIADPEPLGRLAWQPAPKMVIDADQIIDAATPPE